MVSLLPFLVRYCHFDLCLAVFALIISNDVGFVDYRLHVRDFLRCIRFTGGKKLQ